MWARRTLSLGAVAVIVAGCQLDGPVTPRTDDASLSAVAGGVETNISVPITLNVFVACANGGGGELISLNGNLHQLVNVTTDGNGGFHVKQHFQPQGLNGLGLVTGDRYQGVGVTQTSVNVVASQVRTFVNNFRMIGQGSGNNFNVHQETHVTVNPDGTVAVTHGNLRTSCS